MDYKQIRAVKISIEYGRAFQDEHPESAYDFRDGMGYMQIAIKYSLKEKFFPSIRISNRTLLSIVRTAIFGNNNSEMGPIFKGLIPLEEAKAIAKKHKKEALELMISKAGHSVKLMNAALGRVDWSPEELDHLADLLGTGEYTYQNSQTQVTRANTKKLCYKINQRWHKGEKVRTQIAIEHKVHLLKKSLQLTSG